MCTHTPHPHPPTYTTKNNVHPYKNSHAPPLCRPNTQTHQVLNEEYARVVEAALLIEARQARAQRISVRMQALLMEGDGGMSEEEARAEAYRAVEEEEGPVAVRERDPVLDDGRRIQVCFTLRVCVFMIVGGYILCVCLRKAPPPTYTNTIYTCTHIHTTPTNTTKPKRPQNTHTHTQHPPIQPQHTHPTTHTQYYTGAALQPPARGEDARPQPGGRGPPGRAPWDGACKYSHIYTYIYMCVY